MSVQNKTELQGYLRKRHSVTKLAVHLVFVTKYRRKIFDGYLIESLRESFLSACAKLECDLIVFDGEEDHVHLLIEYPPKHSISVLVNNLKSVSSRNIRQHNAHLMTQSKSGLLWSRSYFAASAGGVTIQKLREYVSSQNTPQ